MALPQVSPDVKGSRHPVNGVSVFLCEGRTETIPENIGRKSVSVSSGQTVHSFMVSLRVTSIFLVGATCDSKPGGVFNGDVYKCKPLVRKVEVLAHLYDTAMRLNRFFQADSLARRTSTCCLYGSCLSSFTPKYVEGWAVKELCSIVMER